MKRALLTRAVRAAGSLAALARATGADFGDVRRIAKDPSLALGWFQAAAQKVVRQADSQQRAQQRAQQKALEKSREERRAREQATRERLQKAARQAERARTREGRAWLGQAVRAAGGTAALARATGAELADVRRVEQDPSLALRWFKDAARRVVREAEREQARSARAELAARQEREQAKRGVLEAARQAREEQARQKADRLENRRLEKLEAEGRKTELARGKAERKAELAARRAEPKRAREEAQARFWSMLFEARAKLENDAGKPGAEKPPKPRTEQGKLSGAHVEGYRWTKKVMRLWDSSVRSTVRAWLLGHPKQRRDWPFYQAVAMVALYRKGVWRQVDEQDRVQSARNYRSVVIQLDVEPVESGDFTVKYMVTTGRMRRLDRVTDDLLARLEKVVEVPAGAPPPIANLMLVYSVELRSYRVRTESQVRAIASSRRREKWKRKQRKRRSRRMK
jgi:hypothetical protein